MSTRSRRGVCIVELLMGLSLAGILLAAIMSALLTTVNGVHTNDRYVRSRQAAAGAMDLVLARIRQAKELTMENVSKKGDSYGTLVTMDRATWNSATNAYDNPQYSRFYVGNVWDATVKQNVPALKIGTGASTDPVLARYVNNVVFRSVPALNGEHEYVTVELTIDCRDANGGKTTSYALAGTALARSVVQ